MVIVIEPVLEAPPARAGTARLPRKMSDASQPVLVDR
jgi:hypothetical protein